jgi:hypothetical protein
VNTPKKVGSNMLQCWNGETSVLVSYATPVAARGLALLCRTEKKWIQTTERHIKKWLGSDALLAVKVPQERMQEIYNEL